MQLSQTRRKALVNLTPLIDVVFILLIFFMLASNFIRWHYLELSVDRIEDMELDHKQLSIIKISANGGYSLNDKLLTLDEITKRLREKVRRDIHHPIVLQPEKGTSVQVLVEVLNPLKDFAGENISLAKPETYKAE